ncbi:ERAP1-like C-terminal domain-containing protein, partial [Streptomyces sp. ZG43]
ALAELRAAEPGGSAQLTWARFFASVASDEADLQLLGALLDGPARIDGLEMDQELRWTFLEPLATYGAVDEERIAAELARDDTASGKRHQVRCLAARPSEAVKAQAWAQVAESDALSNALVEATIAGFAQPSQRELTAPYAAKYFEAIGRVWEEQSIQIGVLLVRGLFPSLQDGPEPLAAADAWLNDHTDAPPALRRLVLESRDDLARAHRAQAT